MIWAPRPGALATLSDPPAEAALAAMHRRSERQVAHPEGASRHVAWWAGLKTLRRMDTTHSPANHLEPTKTASPEGPDAAMPGAWAFHCHVLPHAEGMDGMYGMVTALVVQDATAAVELAAAGAPAFSCVIPSTT